MLPLLSNGLRRTVVMTGAGKCVTFVLSNGLGRTVVMTGADNCATFIIKRFMSDCNYDWS